jgi:hypothetical protein
LHLPPHFNKIFCQVSDQAPDTIPENRTTVPISFYSPPS